MMCLYFTSGTTGLPKMTLHTFASYGLGHITSGKYWADLSPSDLHWTVSDTGWAKAAYGCLFGPWTQGCTIFTFHTLRMSPARVFAMLSNYPINTFCAPPTLYRMLVREDMSSLRGNTTLRHCLSAGEPLNPEVIGTWADASGLFIHEGYGQSESTLLVGHMPGMPMKPGSMGRPMPGYDISIINEECVEAGIDEEGDIAVRVHPVRPTGLFAEYWKEAERTAKCFRGDWYITGDRGYKDADGDFWFVGRDDDVINSSGYRIGPFEVESALLEHEAVVESAVVSSPDPLRGEIVKAFVVLASGVEASDTLVTQLQEHVKLVTAPYKYPRKIAFVSSLPKTVSGKIRRVELRQAEWQN
jgi:acyl-coenzyme A synthetase/AMP-(fatty) acid ligase